jgi:asparagine synthetase B (glutamine-hydrolysing)
MCGIAVFFDLGVTTGGRAARSIGYMIRAQDARGPDEARLWASGGVALGADRLAITCVAGIGAQPLDDGRGAVVVYQADNRSGSQNRTVHENGNTPVSTEVK